MVSLSGVSIFLITLLVLMLWMDVALFVKVQHLPVAHYNENVQTEEPPGVNVKKHFFLVNDGVTK